MLNHPKSSDTVQVKEILFCSSGGEHTPHPTLCLFQYSSRPERAASGQVLHQLLQDMQATSATALSTITKKAWIILSDLVRALQLAPSPSLEGHIADISSCESSPNTACVRHNSCGLAASREVPSAFLLPRVNVALQNIQDSKATRRHMYSYLTILLATITS